MDFLARRKQQDMTSTIMTRTIDNLDADSKSLQALGPSVTSGTSESLPLHTQHGPRILDHGHMWHPDNYRTHLRNGSLTIAVNGHLLNKD